jgi:magnesium transporter
LPWLVLALLGGFITVRVLGLFEGAMLERKLIFLHTTYCCNGRKCGVQSSAIIVQGLANNTLSGSLFNRLIKEIALSLLNGAILSAILFAGSYFLLGEPPIIGFVICCALLSVIIIASLIGFLCLCYR